ncbi:MAG: hypothetical protein K2N40_01130, partial [Ureaplasma sp.]|nr:hypothetical protein [Ureaplasma sp.]
QYIAEGLVEKGYDVSVISPYNANNNKTNNEKIKSNNNNKKLNLTVEHMKKYDDFFANLIIGQDRAISKIKEQLISLLYNIYGNSNRPAGVFFCWSNGSWKNWNL